MSGGVHREHTIDRTSGALLRYSLGTFGVTWLFWLPVTFASYGLPSFSNAYVSTWFGDFLALQATTPAHWLVMCGGVLGPLTGAILAWHHRSGAAGLRTLGLNTVDIRISDVRGYLTSLIPIAYFGLASLVVFVLTGVTFSSAVEPLAFLGLLAAGCLLVAGEELGWRGTQLPLLQESRSALGSSIIVGLTWALWHFPLILMWGAGEQNALGAAALVFIPYVLLTIPMAIMHTFAFNSARGLVLVSIVLHGLHNHLNAVLTPNPAPEEALARAGEISDLVLLIVFWVLAVGLTVVFGPDDLASRPKVTASSMLHRGAVGRPAAADSAGPATS